MRADLRDELQIGAFSTEGHTVTAGELTITRIGDRDWFPHFELSKLSFGEIGFLISNREDFVHLRRLVSSFRENFGFEIELDLRLGFRLRMVGYNLGHLRRECRWT